MTKTLYVSDLDGTLLTKEQTLSHFTADTINSLVGHGMLFSYATARSFYTAGLITEKLCSNIPVIVYNGTFILESGTKKHLLEHYFDKSEAKLIFATLIKNDVHPIVYSFIDGKEKFSYVPHSSTEDFLNTRRGDGRDRPTNISHILDGDVFHFSCIDSPEHLFPAYETLKDIFPCVYNRDIYSGEQWLEVHPKNVTKANAALELKTLLGCDRLVCFGDGKNDISMFEVADECYAVENAVKELESIATDVIRSNDENGVAKWLKENITV